MKNSTKTLELGLNLPIWRLKVSLRWLGAFGEDIVWPSWFLLKLTRDDSRFGRICNAAEAQVKLILCVVDVLADAVGCLFIANPVRLISKAQS